MTKKDTGFDENGSDSNQPDPEGTEAGVEKSGKEHGAFGKKGGLKDNIAGGPEEPIIPPGSSN